MFSVIALLYCHALCLPQTPLDLCEAGNPSRLRIGRVEIVRNDVFDNRDDWFFRSANALHTETRESVVRQELLFGEDDLLDCESVRESERNLRALPYLRDADIQLYPARERPNTVDVRVRTWDVWTLSPQVDFKKLGNRFVWAIGLAEKNFLGRGKHAEVAYRSGLDREDLRFFYRDPRLGGSRFALTTEFADQTGGERAALGLHRPFFSLRTEWSFALALKAFDRLDPLYAAGERVAQLQHVGRLYHVQLAKRVGGGAQKAVRVHFQYTNQFDDVENDRRHFGILGFGVSAITGDYVELTGVNRFGVTEDFNLGYQSGAFVGVSSEILGGEPGTSYFMSLSHQQTILRLGEANFLRGSVGWSARHRRGRIENSVVNANLRYLHKVSLAGVLTARARLRYGSRLDPEVQFTLGAHNGLRGYPVHQWVGTRSLLFSVENRWFLTGEIWQLFYMGAAVFADSGYAWPEGQSIDLRDLKTNIGVSLLLGRDRLSSSNPTVRLTLAYALAPVPDHGRWLFSFR